MKQKVGSYRVTKRKTIFHNLHVRLELGTQTAQFILKSINPLTALVDISQNFPKFAHLLKDVKVDEELASGFAYNRARVSGRRNGLWINGMELDAERIDVFT